MIYCSCCIRAHARRTRAGGKGDRMKSIIDIDIQIDAACAEPKVVIRTDRVTPEVESIVAAIEHCMDTQYSMVTAYDGNATVLLSQREIVRVYNENRKLIIQTERGAFTARRTLAEMEATLNNGRFLRIRRSEIITLYKVANFDFSLAGTIHVHFEDGSSTWAARRYVRAIQEALGLV